MEATGTILFEIDVEIYFLFLGQIGNVVHRKRIYFHFYFCWTRARIWRGFVFLVGVQYSTMFDSVKLFPVVVRYVTVDFLHADQIM